MREFRAKYRNLGCAEEEEQVPPNGTDKHPQDDLEAKKKRKWEDLWILEKEVSYENAKFRVLSPACSNSSQDSAHPN
jgi:hypothetical protein